MRFRMSCFKCVREQVGPEKYAAGRFIFVEDPSSPTRFWADFSGDAVLKGTCAQGHECVTVLSYMHYELLFEFSIMAFVDGYYREAVSTAAVALERFYEFYVRAASAQRGISKTAFETFWKEVGGLSERQLGAMMLLRALEGSAVKLPGSGWRQRRNNVVHKGEFPTRERARAFLQETRTVIAELGRELRKCCPEGIEQAREHVLDGPMSVARAGSEYGMDYGEFGSRTLDEEIDELKKDRHKRWRSPD